MQALVHPRSESVAFVGFIIKETELILGGCPRTEFYCDRLQNLPAELEEPKPPQRSYYYASGAFVSFALPEDFSLNLVTKPFSDSLLGLLFTHKLLARSSFIPRRGMVI